jgi:hypothetical protein
MPIYRGTYFIQILSKRYDNDNDNYVNLNYPYTQNYNTESKSDKNIDELYRKYNNNFSHRIFTQQITNRNFNGTRKGFSITIETEIYDEENSYKNRENFKEKFHDIIERIAQDLNMDASKVLCNIAWYVPNKYK